MLSPTQVALFLLPTLMLNLTPGPDMLYVLGRGIAQGRRSALRAVAGVWGGYLFHLLIVSVGLASLLQHSPRGFFWVKLLGAAYLARMGYRSLTSKSQEGGPEIPPQRNSTDSKPERGEFKRGVLVSALNPKVAVFFLAYLPQFVQPEHGSAQLQMALLGLIFSVSASAVNGGVALISGSLSAWLKKHPNGPRTLDRVCGGVMLGLAIKLAI